MTAPFTAEYGCCDKTCNVFVVPVCYGYIYYDCGQTRVESEDYGGYDFVCDDKCPHPRDCYGLPTYAIVSIVIGSLLLLAIAALVVRCCIRKRRERKFAALRNHTVA